MKKLNVITIIAIFFVANFFVSNADTKQEIEKANKKGQIVFLVVTEKDNSQTKEALDIAKKAQKSYPKSAVLELDRGNSANKALVEKYRLSGSPVPLVIVIAKNGCVSGGAPLQGLTAEAIVKMVPTPKEEILIKAISEGKSAFVIFSKKSDAKNKKQIDECQTACQSMGDKAKTVEVDVDDKNEKSFIAKFTIDKNATFPITYVINSQGQVTSMLNGLTEAKSLVSAAQKKVSKGCCPPGGGKTCK